MRSQYPKWHMILPVLAYTPQDYQIKNFTLNKPDDLNKNCAELMCQKLRSDPDILLHNHFLL
jgi:hypothetical protein